MKHRSDLIKISRCILKWYFRTVSRPLFGYPDSGNQCHILGKSWSPVLLVIFHFGFESIILVLFLTSLWPLLTFTSYDPHFYLPSGSSSLQPILVHFESIQVRNSLNVAQEYTHAQPTLLFCCCFCRYLLKNSETILEGPKKRIFLPLCGKAVELTW